MRIRTNFLNKPGAQRRSVALPAVEAQATDPRCLVAFGVVVFWGDTVGFPPLLSRGRCMAESEGAKGVCTWALQPSLAVSTLVPLISVVAGVQLTSPPSDNELKGLGHRAEDPRGSKALLICVFEILTCIQSPPFMCLLIY